MATAARVSLEEYLRTNYEPACELLDGELIQKPMGTLEHMDLERRLERLLERYEQRGLGRAVHELSFRKGEDVRIPDLAFVPPGAHFESGILTDAPMLCVEVLSPSQRQSELFAKCEAYHAWGVPYCWVIDPIEQLAWEYHAHSPVRLFARDGSLQAGEITVSLVELFR
jgi:Uma2 family endonuclease